MPGVHANSHQPDARAALTATRSAWERAWYGDEQTAPERAVVVLVRALDSDEPAARERHRLVA